MASPSPVLGTCDGKPIETITIEMITIREGTHAADHLVNANRMIAFYKDWAPHLERNVQQDMVKLILKHNYELYPTNTSSPRDHKLMKMMALSRDSWKEGAITTARFLFLSWLYGRHSKLELFRGECMARGVLPPNCDPFGNRISTAATSESVGAIAGPSSQTATPPDASVGVAIAGPSSFAGALSVVENSSIHLATTMGPPPSPDSPAASGTDIDLRGNPLLLDMSSNSSSAMPTLGYVAVIMRHIAQEDGFYRHWAITEAITRVVQHVKAWGSDISEPEAYLAITNWSQHSDMDQFENLMQGLREPRVVVAPEAPMEMTLGERVDSTYEDPVDHYRTLMETVNELVQENDTLRHERNKLQRESTSRHEELKTCLELFDLGTYTAARLRNAAARC